jgi:hypothetical protein
MFNALAICGTILSLIVVGTELISIKKECFLGKLYIPF